MGFTANQWAILALVLILGWLIGLLSRSGGSKWRRAYTEERAAREATDTRLAAARERIVELERQGGTRSARGPQARSVRQQPAIATISR